MKTEFYLLYYHHIEILDRKLIILPRFAKVCVIPINNGHVEEE